MFGNVSSILRFSENYLNENLLLCVMAKKKKIVQFRSKNKGKKRSPVKKGVANSRKK